MRIGRKARKVAGAIVAAGAALSLIVGVSEIEADDGSFAVLAPAGNVVLWIVDSAAPHTILTVSGPGVSIRQENTAGVVPGLSNGVDGRPLPDGVYVWELRESFPGLNDDVHDPENGRIAPDPARAPQRVHVKGRIASGAFSIRGGLVVDKETAEPTATRPVDAEEER